MTESFNFVDGLCASIILASAFVSVARGFIREFFGVSAWIGAFLVSYYQSYHIQDIFAPHITGDVFLPVLSYGLTFFVALIVLWVCSRVIYKALGHENIGGIERALGFLFGFARGMVVITLCFIAFAYFIPIEKQPEMTKKARTPAYLQATLDSLSSASPALSSFLVPLPRISEQPSEAKKVLPEGTGAAVGEAISEAQQNMGSSGASKPSGGASQESPLSSQPTGSKSLSAPPHPSPAPPAQDYGDTGEDVFGEVGGDGEYTYDPEDFA